MPKSTKKNPIKKKFIKSFSVSTDYPPNKLIEYCNSFNTCYLNNHYMICSVIIRGILDYIPTIFGYASSDQLSSKLNGRRSFKKALDQIDISMRICADDVLHNRANKVEVIKITKITTDNQISNLLIVLEEVQRQLATNDLRDKGNELLQKDKNNNIKSSKSNLDIMESYIENEEWYKEFIDDKEVWICKKDNLYQIHKQNDHDDFSEPWTQVYPDILGSGRYSVNLVYNNNHLKQFTFIYCDGGRINVVLPKMKSDNENIWEGKDIKKGSYKNIGYYWEVDSLDVKLTKLIGNFYIYNSIEGVARVSKIKMIQKSEHVKS